MLRKQYSGADCFLQVHTMKIRWVLGFAWVLHIRCAHHIWTAQTFDQDPAERSSLGLTSFGSHTVGQEKTAGPPDGSVKVKHLAGTPGTWPHTPTWSLDTWHQRSWAPSPHWLMEPEHGEPAESLLVPGKLPARETLRGQHQFQFNCFSTKRCVNTSLFVYIVCQSCISFPEELKDWTHQIQPRFVCYHGGMRRVTDFPHQKDPP